VTAATLLALYLATQGVAEQASPPDGPTYRQEVTYSELDTVLDGDDQIFTLRAPSFYFEDREIRATWALLWTDRDATTFLRTGGRGDLRVQEPSPRSVGDGDGGFGFASFNRLLASPELEPVRELYLEGPVEFFEGGVRVGSAGALYMDRVEGRGWLADAQIEVREKIGGQRFVFKVGSSWLRISSDGSLVSDRARITTCEHADPHYFIETERLRMQPTDDPELPWRVSLSGNGIRFGDLFTLPLPPINYIADEDGEPALQNLRIGDSGKFGPSIGFGYSRDLGNFGSGIDRLLTGDDPTRFDSKFRVEADYLSSRGLLLDSSLRLQSEDRYRWRTALALIPDNQEDRGLVRVPTDERDLWRYWVRSHARFYVEDDEWVDLRVTKQSDAGVQAEFFEDEYIDYEERETFLHWRKAWGSNYASASLVASADDFVTTVEELPEVEFVRQRTTLLDLDLAPVVYSSATRAGWYRRQEGDPNFEAGYADGEGERSTWRIDSEQVLEMPFALGRAGLRLIPFSTLRWTGWSEAAAADDAPTRTVMSLGARLTTTFWRRSGKSGIQELAPTIGWSADEVYEESGGDPLDLDQTELLVGGKFIDVGLRSRLRGEQLLGLPVDFDGEVRGRYATERFDGSDDGWLPLAFLGELRTRLGNVPVRLRHDSRIDVDQGSTLYSNTLLGFDPVPRMRIDLGFATARDATAGQLFEAVSIAGTYRFTPKWEFEAYQSLNLDTNKSLDFRGIVRRYGHDLIVEFDFGQRSGEGGARFGLNISPALTASSRPSVASTGANWGY
jgi:hypothetical protein